MKLSLVIPAFNEEIRLPVTIRDACHWLRNHVPGNFEIIVVDNGSHDRTIEGVELLLSEIPELKLFSELSCKGKGAAVRRGMLEANGDIRLFMDADHSTGISEVSKVLAKIEEGADVVIASRQHPESQIVRHQSSLREFMGKFFNLIVRRMVGLTMLDTQCGFKAFTAVAAQEIFSRQQLDGFSFDVEVLVLAELLQLNVAEIPVSWENSPDSRVNIISDSLHMFIDLIRLRHMMGRRAGRFHGSCE